MPAAQILILISYTAYYWCLATTTTMNTKRSRSGQFVSYMIICKWIQKVPEVETKDTHSEMVFYGTRKMQRGTAM